MLLTFSGARGQSTHAVPARSVRIVGPKFYCDEDVLPIAYHEAGLWKYAGKTYGSVLVDGPVSVALRDAETNLIAHSARYDEVWISDGVFYTPEEAMALLDEYSCLWLDTRTDACYRELAMRTDIPRGSAR